MDMGQWARVRRKVLVDGRSKRRLRGHGQIKEALLAEELGVMQELPEVAFEACRVQTTRASNLSLVRFSGNDYSVPVRCAHREVVVKGNC